MYKSEKGFEVSGKVWEIGEIKTMANKSADEKPYNMLSVCEHMLVTTHQMARS